MNLNELEKAMAEAADSDIADHSKRFFKTGPGEYGEGDRFMGIRVPVLRSLAKKCRNFSFADMTKLLKSPWHEKRLLSLLILVNRFERADEAEQRRIVTLYLKNTSYINNWDLVDTSAPKILGAWLMHRDKSRLYQMANSEDLWQRRIAIMATLYFIKQEEFDHALRLSEILLSDEHDLIQKAVGWMLREVGNRDGQAERRFLKRHYKKMPRTMLRYAIEKFPEQERQRYLHGTI